MWRRVVVSPCNTNCLLSLALGLKWGLLMFCNQLITERPEWKTAHGCSAASRLCAVGLQSEWTWQCQQVVVAEWSRKLHLILILIEESCVDDFHEVPHYSRQDYWNMIIDNGRSSSVADSWYVIFLQERHPGYSDSPWFSEDYPLPFTSSPVTIKWSGMIKSPEAQLIKCQPPPT